MSSPTESGVPVRGEFIVSVGNAVLCELPENSPKEWEVVCDCPSLDAVERVQVTKEEVESFVKVMHMIQRSCSMDEHRNFPRPLEDVYDVLVYLDAKLKADNGLESYQRKLSELGEQNLYKMEKPSWIEFS